MGFSGESFFFLYLFWIYTIGSDSKLNSTIINYTTPGSAWLGLSQGSKATLLQTLLKDQKEAGGSAETRRLALPLPQFLLIG